MGVASQSGVGRPRATLGGPFGVPRYEWLPAWNSGNLPVALWCVALW